MKINKESQEFNLNNGNTFTFKVNWNKAIKEYWEEEAKENPFEEESSFTEKEIKEFDKEFKAFSNNPKAIKREFEELNAFIGLPSEQELKNWGLLGNKDSESLRK